MTTVASCSNMAEAELLQSLLADSGIECFVPDELFGGTVRIMVANENADEAKRILTEAANANENAGEDDDAEDKSG